MCGRMYSMLDLQAPLLSTGHGDEPATRSMNEASPQIQEPHRDTNENGDETVVWMMCWARLVGASRTSEQTAGTGGNESDGTDETEACHDADTNLARNDPSTEHSSSCFNWTGSLVSLALLPMLLWLQLFLALHSTQPVHLLPFPTGTAYDASDADHERQRQVWGFVQSGIVCFVVASVLYRHAVAEHACDTDTPASVSWAWLVVSLAPEVCTDVILFMVVFNQVAMGIWWMHISTLAFIGCALVLSMCTCRLRIIPHYSSVDDDRDDMRLGDEPAAQGDENGIDDDTEANHELRESDWDHQIFGLLNVTIV